MIVLEIILGPNRVISDDCYSATVMTGTTPLSNRFFAYDWNWGYVVVSYYGVSVFWAPTLTRQQALTDFE